jgi:hypothetical protein
MGRLAAVNYLRYWLTRGERVAAARYRLEGKPLEFIDAALNQLGSRANRALHQAGHTSSGLGLRGLIRDSIGSLLQQAVTL